MKERINLLENQENQNKKWSLIYLTYMALIIVGLVLARVSLQLWL